jgi:hypothetical protein
MRTILLIAVLTIYCNSIVAQDSKDDLAEVLKELHLHSNQISKELNELKSKLLLKIAKKHSFGLYGGYSENGGSVLGSYSFYNSNKIENLDDFIEASITSSFIKEEKSGYQIPIDIYSLNIGYFKKVSMLSDSNKQFTTAIGIGGVFGYENINKGNTELPNGALVFSDSQIIYGGYAGVNLDVFISDRFDLSAKTNIYYHANSDIGKTRFFIGIGVRYSILKN